MHRTISALTLAALLGVTGCPASSPPGGTDAPTTGDTVAMDHIGQDAPGADSVPVDDAGEDLVPLPDTVTEDTPLEDTTAPPDTHPADTPTPQDTPPLESFVKLTPLCVHAPWVVGAGGPFAVAVYGETGCAEFHHAEVQQDGFDVDVTLWGLKDPTGPCAEHDACGSTQWIYTGLVWVDAPNPGAYTVTVEGFKVVVGASSGIIDDPACQDDCAWPELETYAWTLDHLTSQEVGGLCFEPGAPGVVGADMTLTGACQDYFFKGDNWPLDGDAFHCNDGALLFGSGPPYMTGGTVCDTNPLGINDPIMVLGIHHGWSDPIDDTGLFVLHGAKLQ
ncbi:MAG: hypothetical protein ABIK09_18005 [Pseudomonadota bacterium]